MGWQSREGFLRPRPPTATAPARNLQCATAAAEGRRAGARREAAWERFSSPGLSPAEAPWLDTWPGRVAELGMQLIVAAVGRLKDGAERELLGRYRDRFADLGKRLGFGPVTWHELSESRAS